MVKKGRRQKQMYFNKQTLLRFFKNQKYKWKYLISWVFQISYLLTAEIQSEGEKIHLGENSF